MKTKIKLWSLLSAFILTVLCTISFKGFANTEETEYRYTTEYCEYSLPDGSWILGSKCYLPDPEGPCSRFISCIPQSY